MIEEPITVAGVRSTVKPGTAITRAKPGLATVTITGIKNTEGVTANIIGDSPFDPKEPMIAKVDFINIGGLTMVDEKQYILLDGKEYKPQPGENLKGTYRITFIDKKDAEKKYGVKGKKGAVILETIK